MKRLRRRLQRVSFMPPMPRTPLKSFVRQIGCIGPNQFLLAHASNGTRFSTSKPQDREPVVAVPKPLQADSLIS